MKQQTDDISTPEEVVEEPATASVDPRLAELEAQVEEWKTKYLRALADYQNLERRTRVEKEEARVFAAEVTMMKLLPAIDGLHRASHHIHDDGFDLSLREFEKALRQCGVSKIETVGKPFDPFLMECIAVAEGEDGVVLEELEAGYMMQEKVLRPAKVKVGKK